MYQCNHFGINELISESLYNNILGSGRSPESWAWRLFSPDALILIDKIRDHYGKITINTWAFGGELNYCGYREPDSPVGMWTSHHRRGCAFDLHFHDIDAKYKFKNDKLGAYEAVRQDILRNRDIMFPELTGMEADDGIARIHVEGGTNRSIILFGGK